VRRDAGTSGATGPCKSGGGACVGCEPGKRKPLSEAPAGAASAAAERVTAKARIFERIGRSSRLGGAR
jgi:hypothetical protein